jgi:hypothetical protein
MLHVVPVEHTPETPAGVRLEDILTVPDEDEYWACQNIMDIVRMVMSTGTEGYVRKDFDPSDGFVDMEPPFPVIVAAENADGGRLVVSGNAESMTDFYLNQPIPRIDAKGRISFDPPPIADADLVVNTVYWLAGQEQLIGAGPVVTPVIEPMPPGTKQRQSLLVIGWAALALVLGAVVMFVRRK